MISLTGSELKWVCRHRSGLQGSAGLPSVQIEGQQPARKVEATALHPPELATLSASEYVSTRTPHTYIRTYSAFVHTSEPGFNATMGGWWEIK